MRSQSITNQIIAALQIPQVERVSVASDGTEANEGSRIPSISADGRFLAYSSLASNLVPADTNDAVDVFVFDRQTGTTTRVSVASDGTEANEGSEMGDDILRVSISADGRFVTYASESSNLVPGDTNDTGDIFVFDRQTGTTTRVSVASDGTEGNNTSLQPAISADGRFVAYTSLATNLVPGDTNFGGDVFVFDRQTGTTTRVSVASDGAEPNSGSDNGDPSISADGRFVTYTSPASNLVPGDTNDGLDDVFVFDRHTNTTELVSVASDGSDANGQSGDGEISADGRFVVYTSFASNLVSGDTNNDPDIFVFDRQTNTTQRVSVASDGTEGNGFFSFGPTISADGRFVTYFSDASNLVPGDTNGEPDVFVFDRQANTTHRVSVASDGTEGNAFSISGQISADGQYVAYWSDASNLVPGDTNGVNDIFVVQTDVVPPVDGAVKDGDDGDNLLRGTHRDDILRGHGGRDSLFGLKGNDNLDGGEGNDRIYAGEGDDTVLGRAGNDWIWAGKGSDTIVFNEGDGRDQVFDFDQRSHANERTFDRVQLDVSIGSNAIDDFAELEALIASGDIGLSTRGGGLTLTFDNGDQLTLRGVQALSAEDWLFT